MGLSLAKNALTPVYQGTTPLSDGITAQIERAFDLPKGWLSGDHEFLYKLKPDALAAHTQLASLPAPVREKIYELVLAIANDA